MKIIGITGVGTYPVPWLSYGLASIYHAVDEIVVVNSGYNFPLFTEYDVPLPEATETIKELDVNGKIHDVQHVTWEKAAKYGPELQPEREGIRAIGMTYANDVANDLGADWILRFDSDQVFFPNVKNVREVIAEAKTGGFQFLEYKAYWLSPNLMLKGGEVSNSDGAKLFKAMNTEPKVGRQWYVGEGAIVHWREQTPSDAITTGHFREVCPPLKDGSIDRRGLFLYYFQRMMFHGWDQNRLYKGKRPGYAERTFDDMVLLAFNSARHIAHGPWDLVPADPKPPPVIETGPLKYIA